MSWLDKYFTKGVTAIQAGGIAVPAEPTINFVGATIADDPSNGRTTITVGGGGGSTFGVCTPEQFGALGDATTDDAALTAAKTAFSAGTAADQALQIGARPYLTAGMAIGSPWPMGFSIFGKGNKSAFTTTANAPCILMASSIPAQQALTTTFSDLSFVGSGKASGLTSQDGLRVGYAGSDGAGRVTAINCYAKDMGGIGHILAYSDYLGAGPVSFGLRAESCASGLAGLEGEAHGYSAHACTVGAYALGNFNMIGGQFAENDLGFWAKAGGNDGHGVLVGVSFVHNTVSLQLDALNNGEYFTGCRFFDGSITIANGNLKYHTFGDCLVAPTALNANGKTRWLNCTFGTAYYTSSSFTGGENEFINPRGEDGTIPVWIGQNYHVSISYASNADKTLTSQQSWAEVVEIPAGSESAAVNLINPRTPSRGEKQWIVNRTLQTVNYFWGGAGTGMAIPTLKSALVGCDYSTGANAICYALDANNATVGVARPGVTAAVPSALALTGFFKDFSAAPWAGTASAGNSGSHSLVTDAADPVA